MTPARMPVFCAKCYWPGVTEAELATTTAQARQETAALERAGVAVACLGSMLFVDDDVVLFVFETASRGAVLLANERVQIPCERIMESVWLPASRSSR